MDNLLKKYLMKYVNIEIAGIMVIVCFIDLVSKGSDIFVLLFIIFFSFMLSKCFYEDLK